jgi:ATP-binding cassette, subfamily C, bacterial
VGPAAPSSSRPKGLPRGESCAITSAVASLRNIVRLFFKAEKINPWTVLACLLVASVVEGIGFASLVPLLWIVTDPSQTANSPVIDFTRELVDGLGLSLGVGPLVVFFVCTLVVRSLLTLVAMRHVGYAVADFSTGLQGRLIQNLFRARWDYLVQHRSGRVAAAMGGQADRAGRAYYLAAMFFAQVIQTTGYLVVAFFVSWQLALASLGVGGVMILLLHFLVRTARKAGARQTRWTTDLVTFLVDTLNNIKPLRAMAKERAFTNLLEEKTAALKKALRRQVVSAEGLRNGNEILAAVCFGAGFFVAISLWRVPIVDLVVVGVLLTRTTSGVAKIQQQFQKALMVESAFLEVQELITETAAAPEPNPGRRQALFEHECRLEEVSFAHVDTPVLRGVSLVVPAGRVTVLTGPSGAGKTTIADLILGLYEPNRGRVLLDGVPLKEIDLQSWRQLVGYVPQELVLFHDSIYANVALGDRGIGAAEVREALELAGAWEFVCALPEGMLTEVGEGGAKLSGGQRQRIALARALVGKPRLLILDEVTSALDPDTEWQICRGIRDLAENMAVLAITHRPTFLEIADLIYRIEDGRAVEAFDAPQVATLDRHESPRRIRM